MRLAFQCILLRKIKQKPKPKTYRHGHWALEFLELSDTLGEFKYVEESMSVEANWNLRLPWIFLNAKWEERCAIWAVCQSMGPCNC